MTPDQDLSARLLPCPFCGKAPRHFAGNKTFGESICCGCGCDYDGTPDEWNTRSGQLITLADHERAVAPWGESWMGGVKHTLFVLVVVLGLVDEDIDLDRYDETINYDLDSLIGELLKHRGGRIDRAVQAAVAKAVDAEAAIWHEAVTQHSGDMAAKYTATKAAAIRSRGVAG